jgi:hypothetical protein
VIQGEGSVVVTREEFGQESGQDSHEYVKRTDIMPSSVDFERNKF